MGSNSTNSEVAMLSVKAPLKKKEPCAPLFITQRVIAFFAVLALFIPAASAVRVSEFINSSISVFTSAFAYSTLTKDAGFALRSGSVDESAFVVVMIASILITLGIAAVVVATCMSLGNLKYKRLSATVLLGGSVASAVGLVLTIVAKGLFEGSSNGRAIMPKVFFVYVVVAVVLLVLAILELMQLPKADRNEKYEMDSKYKLLIMFLPFALLIFLFSYLPLWGWRYAFFDYKAGETLSSDKFVGFKWFTYLFQNTATRQKLGQVLINTLAMSGLGVLTSWVPLVFAICLTEISSHKFRRVVQTLTTIPNFISWMIVYTVALAIFDTQGFLNTIGQNLGIISSPTNYLMSDSGTWFKMLAWGLWKGTGWSAIIYISGISGIDRQLYEAATVDGANRFQRIIHVTVPGLIPTYMVMLLMSVAGMLSNGLDQYLMFTNPVNRDHMEVLDLYVYNLGIMGGSIPLSTVIGMAKSIVSVALLFMANGVSKMLRGESIV